jgi:hypothetical protein
MFLFALFWKERQNLSLTDSSKQCVSWKSSISRKLSEFIQTMEVRRHLHKNVPAGCYLNPLKTKRICFI